MSGYPLSIPNISSNFINELFSGFNFENYPANIHWDHLELHKIDAGAGSDLIWDSDHDNLLDSMVSCPACHDPHGNLIGPNLTRGDLGIQYGVDINGEYGEITSIEYQHAGGDLYCVGCHGVGVKYYRSYREVLNFSDLHISPVTMTGCIQSGCHFSNILTVEHIDERNLSCATCHQSSVPNVVDAIDQGNTSCFQCHNPHSGGSHATHIDAARGPFISCPDCHGTQSPPLFADGQDLANTSVCDICHSPGGIYDGVNDSVIGAKYNWAGVYNNSTNTLTVGKEKWCAGCHDSAPSLIQGVEAQNIVGDESNFGYYATGHGANNIIECSSCHNFSSPHIDGLNRTYSPDSDYLTYDPASDAYQEGYRLIDVSTGYAGKYPMHIPRTGHVYPPGFREDWEFALCYECHNKTQLFNGGNQVNGSGAGTNFRENYSARWISLHDIHTDGRNGPLGPETPQYDSDFNNVADSRMSCPACHNVHGSRSPAMVRTGELIDKVPALNLKYVDNEPGQTLNFISRDLLNLSTGAGMDVSSGQGQVGLNGVCNMCHAQQVGGPSPVVAYYRDPIVSVPDFADFHTTPVDMTGCIQSGCHISTIITTEHIERGLDCGTCHQSSTERVITAIDQGNTSCFACHDPHTGGSHLTHLEDAKGPHISCPDCHSTQSLPLFADGKTLENTTVCDQCHSPSGTYDGVNDPDIGAKPSWDGVYNTGGSLKTGKELWCIGCHDQVPANINGGIAPNKAGDGNTYGYYITGHGSVLAYPAMSWQDTTATGNQGANTSCDECHDSDSDHIHSGPGNSRLRQGYENNQANSNCNNCHPPGTSATADPQFYTGSAEYELSVHRGTNCTECHEVHGAAGAYLAMTKGDRENLCLQCHGGQEGHATGTQFGKDGKDYSLECTSCHNIHVITGMYTPAEPDKSPITLFSDITRVWGDGSGEKMDDYAGSGTYRTPKGDNFSGSQLPDYNTFCLDCHSVSQGEFGSHGGISWGTDEPHGLNSANEPNGGGTCPDWYACGKASGWDGDLCIGDNCWPVLTRGMGDQLWSRSPYNHGERIAGENFVLSCSDCHVTHESGVGSKLRLIVNNGTGSTIWNTMCNNCHYYYSDWHAGMSCGSASCHVYNSIHRMDAKTGSSGTRVFNQDLVAYMRFDNTLSDSGTWRMHGRWFDTSGSFAAGKSGSAVVLDGNQPIELGTRNEYWSTDAGKHGTWVYSEMKYNMTLEAWVYPTGTQTGTENHIFSKHTYTDGGYVLLLKEISGQLRAALLTNVNGGGDTGWNGSDCNGLRGAFSTIPVPLNEWTHVAAVFDTNLPDRDLNDLSTGRIRIFVNGEDVTTSYASESQCFAQPDAGEEDMFPYSEMNIKNESRCYEGHWCASALSIGGVMWADGARKGLIGRIDEAKVWNVAKDPAYFELYDAQVGPMIIDVEGVVDRDWIMVTFSEEVYTDIGQSGSLQPGDFTITDTDDSRTILSVSHTPGEAIANLILSSPLDTSNDIDVDTIAAVNNSIFDEYDLPAGTDPITIIRQQCPTGPVIFPFNESGASLHAFDQERVLNGTVYGTGTFVGDGFFHGDGSGTYIDFDSNPACLQSSTAMTLEARIYPTGLEGTANYIRRILARDTAGNYQMSVWRNNDWVNYSAPDGAASIAFWVKPVDSHGGNAWKPVLTDYNACPIVSDHWYQVRTVWNSSKAGGIPGDIFVDDQGTDGNGTGENWFGYINCTDSDQSLSDPVIYLYQGDQIDTSDGAFIIGANVNNHANNVFNGNIDWIRWQNNVDYSGVDYDVP